MDFQEDILKSLAEYKPREQFGWGSDTDFQFEEFKNRPYQPFSRLDKISKCCDFLVQGKQQIFRSQEDDFVTVGAEKGTAKTQHKKTNKKQSTYYQPQQYMGNPSFRWDHSSQRRQKFTTAYRRVFITKTKFKDSVTIQADWINQHEASKQFIEKTQQSLFKYEPLFTSGNVRYYNSTQDKVKPSHEKQIPLLQEDLVSSSIEHDQYLKKIIEENQGNEKITTVYTTDRLLFAILTLKYSVYPWDIVVIKRKNQIIFDKAAENRNRSTYLELQTINENTSSDMKEDERNVQQDCEESSIAAQNFLLMSNRDIVIDDINEELSGNQQENAYYSEDFAFNYIKIHVHDRIDKGGRNEELKTGDEKFQVIVRTQTDGCDLDGNPILIKSVNECENNSNWRKQLETSAGQLTSNTFMANTNNMAKWLCQAMIAQIDDIKIGFITRQHQKDVNKHSLLRVESYKFRDIQSIIGFKTGESLQNLRYIVEYFSKQEDGEYVMLKPAYKNSIKIYRLEQSDNEQQQEEEEQQ